MSARETAVFYICVAPWLIGFVFFSAGPILASFGLSFTDYTITMPPRGPDCKTTTRCSSRMSCSGRRSK